MKKLTSETTKNPVGRPPRDAQPATTYLHLRVTPSRKLAYERQAEKAGKTTSMWITSTLDAEVMGK